MTRVGIKERRILKGRAWGLSYMGIRAVKQLLEKDEPESGRDRSCLDRYDYAPDHHFPTTSSIIAYHTGCKNAMTFDMQGLVPAFCMLWRRAPIISVRGVIRRWLLYQAIR